jgi:hypothetical protein
VLNAFVQLVIDESYPPQTNTHSNLPAFLKYLSSLGLPELNSVCHCGVTSCHLPVLLNVAVVPSRCLVQVLPIVANGQLECDEEEWEVEKTEVRNLGR